MEGRPRHLRRGRGRIPARAADIDRRSPTASAPDAAQLDRLRGDRLRDADRRLHGRPHAVRQPLEVRAAPPRRQRAHELVDQRRREEHAGDGRRHRRRRGHGLGAGDGRQAVGVERRPQLPAARQDADPDIWNHEVYDSKLAGPGDGWGPTNLYNNINISYFAPAYYRVFKQVDGEPRLGSGHPDRLRHDRQHAALSSNKNTTNGLVPGWCTSTGRLVERRSVQLPVRRLPHAVPHRHRLVPGRRPGRERRHGPQSGARAGVRRADQQLLQRHRRRQHRRRLQPGRHRDLVGESGVGRASRRRSSAPPAWAP